MNIDSTKKLANQGMISMETHHTGDLIIQFDVEFPPMNFFQDLSMLQVTSHVLLFKFLSKLCRLEIGKYSPK